MRFSVRLLLCLVFAFAIICSAAARSSISISGDEPVSIGRSLKVNMDDYGGPEANRGHDPPSGRGRGGRGGGGDWRD